MGLFKLKFPKWYIDNSEFISDDLSNYLNPHLDTVFDDIRSLIPKDYLHRIFICGGFAAYVAGITKEHTDIDIYCMTEKDFKALLARIRGNPEVTNITAPLKVGDYGYRFVFEYRNLKFDLISNTYEYKPHSSVVDVISKFDINWSMAGLDLSKKQVIIHPHALQPFPKINSRRWRRDVSTEKRLIKYRDRLARQLDEKVMDKMIKIAKAIVDENKKTQTIDIWNY